MVDYHWLFNKMCRWLDNALHFGALLNDSFHISIVLVEISDTLPSLVGMRLDLHEFHTVLLLLHSDFLLLE